jgi:hypothetical protein
MAGVKCIGYADPPYPGQAKLYADDPNCCEVNHRVLIGWLDSHFDGWALSTSSPALRDILPMCPEGVRVAAWVKPFASFKPGVNPAYCWEPVIWKPAVKSLGRDVPTVRDWVAESITLKKGLTGVKPVGFSLWLFDLLGLTVEDEFVDVFPGSGAVARAHRNWQAAARPFQLELVEAV